MNESKRLLSEGATDFERRLLAAVLRERPSALQRARMLQGLGLSSGAAVLWAATAQAMVTSAGGKFVLGLAAASAIGLSVLPLVQQRAERSEAERMLSVPAPSAPVVAPSIRVERARITVPSIDDSPNELRAQIELLDLVTQAVNHRDGARAAALLDRFDQQFPTGALQREARALRRSARKLPR